jgi:AraC-like DNA-binding protein
VENNQTSYRYHPVAKRDRDWGLFVTTTGQSRIGPGTPYPPGGHPKGYDFLESTGRSLSEYQMIYISAGQGWFKSEATGKINVAAGSVFLLFPGVWHSYGPTPSNGWTEHWVGFNGSIARHLVRRGFFTPANPVLRTKSERHLLALYQDLYDATRDDHPALQQILAAGTLRILAWLYSSQQSTLAGDGHALRIVRQAVTRIRESNDTRVDLQDLARQLGVSYSWFRQTFRHYTGFSPHQYWLDIRLARARDLLAQTSLTIKETAERVGFEDAQYFSRLFHKRIGLSPGVWRERIQHNGHQSRLPQTSLEGSLEGSSLYFSRCLLT